MIALLMVAAASAAAAPAAAPEAEPLRLETQVLAQTSVAAADGTTRIALSPPGRVVPGDRMMVQVTYRNAGAQPLGGLVIADPIPPGLAYRAVADGSALPELSVDGRRFGPLATLTVALADGGTRSARADDVTHVRWRVPGALAAGGGGRFAFLAVVR